MLALWILATLSISSTFCWIASYLTADGKIPNAGQSVSGYGGNPNVWSLPELIALSSNNSNKTQKYSQHAVLSRFIMYLQTVHQEVNGENLEAYCGRNNFKNKHVDEAEKRYRYLGNGIGTEKIFVAANLYNNERILPNMVMQLTELARVLGPKRVFISLYENGSDDRTKQILRMLQQTLAALEVPHRITIEQRVRPKKNYHRIKYMAELRNRAMEPLYNSSSGRFGKVVFINDVFFCLPDLLELIHQANAQGAHLTCAEDFVIRHGSLVFYDTWVARDMLGRAFRGMRQNIADDGGALVSQLHGQPFQVQCCWNGIAIIDAQVFDGREGIRFRRSAEGECSASECSLLCNDMWTKGYQRAVVVPRVKLSYEIDARDQLRIPLHKPRDLPFSRAQKPGQTVAFRPGPVSVYCHPLNSADSHVPDGVASFVPLMAEATTLSSMVALSA
ncbi:hypothetical protein GGI25_004043 [Coemansia spiralis]|uniref:Uncharacterized protein n=2 Tax=Coemansia TaxID=4863 RepID=A0A9W8G4Z7_9FUNG|nr:hypothetical protein EDC05_004246 [Coemansia umbellata]KAJ2623839.1 hypothetical protein GGI26_002077 [Coemansia sp. RSA 1358]KAJ2675305.1 hypothetical protein GGI25_004043 [Coemansia spiralis]